MESEDKSRKEGAEKQEIWALKLKQGKRGGPITPPPTWKLSPDEEEQEENGGVNKTTSLTLPSTISARKLCANLWEIQHQHHHQPRMSKAGMRNRQYRDKGLEFPTRLVDPSNSPPRQVATYHPPSTSASSLDSRGRMGESSHNLKTSTEFLKVLNRIWSLEEQHASNVSLVKALKIELDTARIRMKELLREQQTDREEIDDLMKQIAEDKLYRKSKENDRIKAALQTVRDELEGERKSRRRSETLQRKLARELSEVKSAFSKALKDLERQRKARTLLEELCDEFAKGIGDYEQEARAVRHKSEKDHGARDSQDRLIVHISEAWLDERLQMKLAEARCDVTEKNTIVDKLSFEIETFLKAKRSRDLNDDDFSPLKDTKRNSNLRRHSLESFPLHAAASAPQDLDDEDDSVDSDSHCFELQNKNMSDKTANGISKPKLHELEDEAVEENDTTETKKPNALKKRLGTVDRAKGHDASVSQMQFEEYMDRTVSCNDKRTRLLNMGENGGHDKNLVEINQSQKTENFEVANLRKEKKDEMRRSNSNNVIDDLLKKSRMLLADGVRVHREEDVREECNVWRGIPSPVQQWVSRFAAPDLDISESPSQRAPSTKGNTLKARLMEARLEGQHSRLKASKG